MSKRREFDGQELGGSPSGIKKPRVCVWPAFRASKLCRAKTFCGVSHQVWQCERCSIPVLSILNRASQAQPSFLPPKGDLESLAGPPSSLPAKPVTSAVRGRKSHAADSTLIALSEQASLDAIAAARAKVAAKFATFNRGAASSTPAQAAPAASTSANAGNRGPASNDEGGNSTAQAIAEARKRIEAMRAKQARNANPYLAAQKAGASASPVPSGSAGAGAGASGIHPLLAQNDVAVRSSKDRYKPMAPKFATMKVSEINL